MPNGIAPGWNEGFVVIGGGEQLPVIFSDTPSSGDETGRAVYWRSQAPKECFVPVPQPMGAGPSGPPAASPKIDAPDA